MQVKGDYSIGGIYYGWVVVAAFAVLHATVYGMYTSFGIFFKPISEELDLSRTAASAAPSFYLILLYTSALFWGLWLDRWGARGVVAICGVVIGLAWFFGSTTHSVWQLYLFFGFLMGIGAGSLSPGLAGLVARWFDKRRGLALGIGLGGTSGGILLFPPVARLLIDSVGWRDAAQAFAFVAWGVVIVIALLLREPSRRTGATRPNAEKLRTASGGSPDHGDSTEETSQSDAPQALSLTAWQALRTQPFWLVALMMFVANLVIFLILVHLVPRVTDTGVSATTAGFIMSVVGLCSMVGKVVGGLAGDHIGPHRAFTVAMIVLAVAFLWLILSDSAWMFFLFAILFGLGFGGWAPQFAAMLARMFGPRHMAGLYGALFTTGGMGGVLGPIIAGFIFDTTDSYSIAFGLAGILSLVAAALPLMLRRSYHKIGLSQ